MHIRLQIQKITIKLWQQYCFSSTSLNKVYIKLGSVVELIPKVWYHSGLYVFLTLKTSDVFTRNFTQHTHENQCGLFFILIIGL